MAGTRKPTASNNSNLVQSLYKAVNTPSRSGSGLQVNKPPRQPTLTVRPPVTNPPAKPTSTGRPGNGLALAPGANLNPGRGPMVPKSTGRKK